MPLPILNFSENIFHLSMEMELLDLPSELILRYALELNLGEINHLCRVSREFNKQICTNEHFWRMKFIRDFGDEPGYAGSWRIFYLEYHFLRSLD